MPSQKETPTMTTRTDKRGNTIEDGFNGHHDRSRYFYDSGEGLPGDGWQQYDTEQDAHYYGVWVNMATRQTFSYAEGDTCLTTCPDDARFAVVLQEMADFHGPPPGHVRSIDAATGEYQTHPAERPTIENPNPTTSQDILMELLGA
jgi:hypothetical protein